MGRKKPRAPRKKSRDPHSNCDITLSDSADALCVRRRLRKGTVNRNVDDVNEADDVLADEIAVLNLEPRSTTEEDPPSPAFHITHEIWFLLSKYMRPQDVLTFSLICRDTYEVVQRPLFWISMYRRYYSFKQSMPTFLKKHCLKCQMGLKAKIIRSFFYTYPPYRQSLKKPQFALESIINYRCDLMWVQRACDKEVTENNNNALTSERFIYSFRLSNRPDDSRSAQQSRIKTKFDHNPDDTCRLLEVICQDYIDIKCVNGMRLRVVNLDRHCLQMKFSSSPLSRFCTDYGAVNIYLNALQPPTIYGWWHPHFYNQCY